MLRLGFLGRDLRVAITGRDEDRDGGGEKREKQSEETEHQDGHPIGDPVAGRGSRERDREKGAAENEEANGDEKKDQTRFAHPLGPDGREVDIALDLPLDLGVADEEGHGHAKEPQAEDGSQAQEEIAKILNIQGEIENGSDKRDKKEDDCQDQKDDPLDFQLLRILWFGVFHKG